MKRKTFVLIAAVLAIAVGLYVWQNFLKTAPAMRKLEAEYRVNSNEFYAEFEENEDAANEKYVNRIVEIIGELESIEMNEGSKPVINLKTEGFGMIKFTMESNLSSGELNELELNSTLLIRGECIGYLLDVLIERSIILDPS